MSEFVARVRAQLDVNGLKAQLDSVTKERTVKVNVVTSGTDFLKGLNNSGLSNNAAAMGRSVGKSYSTALQNQINAVVKTQRTAFSGPLKDASKEYVNWWNKTLDKTNKQFSTLDATTASNKTLTWLKNNTKASKDYGTALRDLATKQRNATSTKELQGYNKEFRNIVSQAQVAGKTGRTFFGEIGRGFKQIGQFVGTYGVYMKAVQTIKQMAGAVKDVDDAMTELRKVTDAPMSQVTAYFDEATESAKKYGQTISDVIRNTADWQRLGYNLKDAKQLSDMTTLYQNVGDNMTQEKASESMVSTLQGFQLATDQAEHIVDSFNEVGNNFAIGSDGIGEALKRSASSMYAAGNTMEETIGLVTAANEVVNRMCHAA